MIAAVQSGDPIMLEAFRAPPVLVDAQGKDYDNPASDLHTQTCRQLFPEIFIEPDGSLLDQSGWVKRAKDESRIKLPGKPRDFGKKINFGILYFQSAGALSEQLFVPLETTEQWVSGHQQLYSTFHSWAKEQKGIGEARGWARLPWSNRQRYCRESNAKGSGESTGVMATNAMIQSTGADICKYAMIKCAQLKPQYPNVEMIGQVHDELILEGPGNLQLDLAKSKYKDGVLVHPYWVIPQSVYEWVAPFRQAMIDAETEIFGGVLTGSVGAAAIGMWWSK